MQYPTDDGDFKNIPKDIKQHTFSFLKKGKLNTSLVCKSFNEANEANKAKSSNGTPNILKLVQGRIYKISISGLKAHKLVDSPDIERFYNTTLFHSPNFNVNFGDICKFFSLLHKNSSDRGFVSFAQYLPKLPFNLGERFDLSVKEEKIHEYLAYIDGLKIKSADCEIEMGLELQAKNLVKTCSMM